jgi:lipopolysaccharide export system protein LptC
VLRLTTPTLTVYPDEERMETAAAVARNWDSPVRPAGMKANNATREVQLGGRGQLLLPPRAAH